MNPLLDAGLQQEILAPLSAHARRRTFRKGARLWREGDSEGLLITLRHGQVKIFRASPAGSLVTLFLFGPGTTFGFMPFLDGGPYPASALALTDVEADVVSREALRQVFVSDPAAALFLVGQLARRLREAMERLSGQVSRGSLPRVAGALLALLEEARLAGRRPMLELPVSSREFALAVGLQPETFSRTISRLVQEGLLARQGRGRFEVLNVAALRAVAAAATL